MKKSNKYKYFVIIGDETIGEEEAYEYAKLTNNYPITHEDCMEVLNVVADINMRTRLSGEKIAEELKKIYSEILSKDKSKLR